METITELKTITKVKINPEDVKTIFANAKSQKDYIENIYKLVIPRWDDVLSVGEHPTCSSNTWHRICNLAIAFDDILNKSRPNPLMCGGAWMNSGFSGAPQNDSLDLWEIGVDESKIKYNETTNRVE